MSGGLGVVVFERFGLLGKLCKKVRFSMGFDYRTESDQMV